MKRVVLVTVVGAALLMSSVVLAQDNKPAGEQVQSQAGAAERGRGRLQALSPEERAKLREKWQDMSEEERAKLRSQMRDRLGGDRPGPEAMQQRTRADQAAALKQQHAVTIGELQSIKQLAIKEKAPETAKALERLIARHEEDYQRRLKQLEQRLQRVRAESKVQGGDQKAGAQRSAAPADATKRDAGRQRQKDRASRSKQ